MQFRTHGFDSFRQLENLSTLDTGLTEVPNQPLGLIQGLGQFRQPLRTLRRDHINWYSNHINPRLRI